MRDHAKSEFPDSRLLNRRRMRAFAESGNSRLKTLSAPWSKDVATRWRRGNRDKLRRFFQTRYGAASWSKERRVIARIEASRQGTDVRFIVTNLLGGRGKYLYEKVYCVRGKMENLIKEHKRYTKSDRTSCHRREANQFRVRRANDSLDHLLFRLTSAHRCLLVAAEVAGLSPEAFALANRNF